MNILRMRPSQAALFLIAVFALLSCEKPESNLGLDLQPDEDLVNVTVTDTFALHAYSERDDSVRSDDQEFISLGGYNDPVFGKTIAEAALQTKLSTSSIDFTPQDGSLEDLEVDSVVLSLAYRDSLAAYGNGLGPQTWKVYQLENRLYLDSAYYTNDQFAHAGQNLLSDEQGSIIPRPNDSIYIDTTRVAPLLRLRLKNSFGQELIDQSNTGNLDDQEAFTNYFKGLKIEIDQNATDLSQSSVVSFNMQSAGTYLALYFTNTALDSSMVYPFRIGGQNIARVSTFRHDYSNAAPQLMAQLDGDTAMGQTRLFLQGGAGVRAFLRLPNLQPLLDSAKLTINKAQLIFPYEASLQYPPVNAIQALGENEDGVPFLLPDETNNPQLFGGQIDEENAEYRVDITRYMELVTVNPQLLRPLQVVPRNTQVNAQRVVLHGPEYPNPANPQENLKLELTLTKY